MHTARKEKEMDWAHPGRILTTKIGYRKNMEGKWTSADEKDDAVLDADICIWKASRRSPSARRVATTAI